MENRFKVGDKVRCIEIELGTSTVYANITLNKVYEVVAIYDNFNIAIKNDVERQMKYPVGLFIELPSIPMEEQEPEFKAGDFVECIAMGIGDNITLGKEYKVLEDIDNVDGCITIFNDSGKKDNYPARRFESVKQEQEPNYMMVWDTVEKEAEKLEVFADLSDNPRYNNVYPVHAIKNNNTERRLHAKTIKQWKKDTGFLFENSLYERFFKGDVVWIFSFKDYTIYHRNIVNVNNGIYAGVENTLSEIMTKESAEKYFKEHQPKYRPFTMEEFKAYRDCWFMIKSGSLFKVESYSNTAVAIGGDVQGYRQILENFTFEDGTPCGVKE